MQTARRLFRDVERERDGDDGPWRDALYIQSCGDE